MRKEEIEGSFSKAEASTKRLLTELRSALSERAKYLQEFPFKANIAELRAVQQHLRTLDKAQELFAQAGSKVGVLLTYLK